MTLSVQMRRPFVIVNDDAGIIARGLDVLNRIEIGQAEAAGIFDTRAQFIAWPGPVVAGRTYWVGGLPFLGQIGATVTGLTGLVPHPRFLTNIMQFNAVGYTSVGAAASGIDSAPAVQAAANYNATNNLGPVYVPNGRFRLGSTITCTGFSGGFIGQGKNATMFVCTHTDGAGIRWTNDYPVWRDIMILPGGARSAVASYDVTMPGLRVEIPDAPFASTTRTRLIDFNGASLNHPGSGCVVIGPSTGQFVNGQYSGNKGHGLHFAEEIEPRTNFADVPGLCTIETNQFFNNGGHAVYVEGTNEFSSPAVRIDVKNNEIGSNATNASVRAWPSEIYLRGAQFDVRLNVFKSVAGNTTIEGWCVSGVGIVIENNRYIEVARAGTITSHSTLPTRNVRVSGMQMINSPAAYDPLVLVRKEAGAPAPQGVQVNGWSGGVLTRLVGTDATIGVGGPERVLNHVQSMPSMLSLKTDVTVNNTTEFQALTDISPRLADGELVHFEWTCVFTSTAAADIRLDVVPPAGSTFEYGVPDGTKVGSTELFSPQNNQLSSVPMVFGGGAVSSRRTVTVVGYCLNGSTEGPLQFRFAQGTADASDTTVHAGMTSVKIWRPMR
jgi:hypothetical protein